MRASSRARSCPAATVSASIPGRIRDFGPEFLSVLPPYLEPRALAPDNARRFHPPSHRLALLPDDPGRWMTAAGSVRFVSAAYERPALSLASHWSLECWHQFAPEHTIAASSRAASSITERRRGAAAADTRIPF